MTDDKLGKLEGIALDISAIQKMIPNYTSEKLCEMIVSTRYFGFDHEICVACMEELATRRTQGDIFAFEEYIEAATKEMPELDVVQMDWRTILSRARNQ